MRPVTVLALLTSPADRQSLENIFSHSNWDLRFAASLQEAEAINRDDNAVGVVISDLLLPNHKCWRDVLAALQTLVIPPALIVVDARADGQVWAEVLNLGGYDLIMKPFDSAEVLRTVSAAWLSWKHRLEAETRIRKLPQSAGPQRYVEPLPKTGS